MLKLGVLASGRGSNFTAIQTKINSGYFNGEVIIAIVVTDNDNASVIQKAIDRNIPIHYYDPRIYSIDEYDAKIATIFNDFGVNLVILAGYMRIVHKPILDNYTVMNIHPSLLPSFPGLNAQKQALDYGVKVTGCTVHYVDEGVDTGPIIVQAVVPVHNDDTEERLALRILDQEHSIYSYAIKLHAEGVKKS
jgi:phosphoribosylglycinamide formyltransferase-1